MKLKTYTKRRNYTKLGNCLRKARQRLNTEPSADILTVDKVANFLGVSRGFVYQVEQGKRKPKDGDIESWASVYGIPSVELWRCLGRIPLDFVASYKKEPEATSQPIPIDPFAQLTEEEKIELRAFLKFVRWVEDNSP